MTDTQTQQVFLDELRVMVKVGINPQEQDHSQELRISVDVEFEPRVSARAEPLVPEFAAESAEQGTVCYAKLAALVESLGTSKPWRLVEELAAAVIEGCFADSRVTSVRVRVTKPAAVPAAAAAGIVMAARRDGRRK